MQATHNEFIRIGPGTACAAPMRCAWQPVVLLDEFDPALEPRCFTRVKRAELARFEQAADKDEWQRREYFSRF